MIVRLATNSIFRLSLLIGLWLMAMSVQAQPVPPTYKGGLTLTKPVALWRLDIMGGHQFWGGLDIIQGRLRIRDSFNWSGSLSYEWRSNNRFTVTYINQPTELRLNSYSPFDGVVGDRRLTDLNVHYILVGSIQEFSTHGPLRPFAGVQAGIVIADPSNPRFGTETRFAVSATGGACGTIAGPLGWKVQAMLLVPILWTQGGLFCGPGGCSIGVAGGSVIAQMHTNAGLTVSF